MSSSSRRRRSSPTSTPGSPARPVWPPSSAAWGTPATGASAVAGCRTCQIAAIRPDQGSVGLSEEELLRRFVACRDTGDGDGALRWWGDLVEANFDRVRGMVDVRASRYG